MPIYRCAHKSLRHTDRATGKCAADFLHAPLDLRHDRTATGEVRRGNEELSRIEIVNRDAVIR